MMSKYHTPLYFAIGLTVIFVLSGCQDQKNDSESRAHQLDSLSQELAMYKRTTDSLKALIEKGNLAASYPVYFGSKFDTIDHPEAYIEQALKDQPEMIPLQPVLGGKMAFRQIKVLTANWVLATYNDGHVEGQSIYEYELGPDGKLSFTRLASSHP